MKKDKLQKLQSLLEEAHAEFLKSNEIQHDALAPALVYKRSRDKEFAAFICSILAYGRIVQVKRNIQRVLEPMGSAPVTWLTKSSDKDLLRALKGWAHRFNTSSDMFLMLKILRHIYKNHESLETFLNPTPFTKAYELIETLHGQFHQIITDEIHFSHDLDSFNFFLPDPKKGGACKRMNLFLKWMVRNEAPDLGLWKQFHKRNLVIPLDTHIYKQAKSLKLTKRSAANWETAQEITNALALMDPMDPTKYDFALCHLGIRGKIIPAASLGK